ncbi:DUF4249 domain-containing protein [Sphingobacterium sp. LRF_L2]|uniref:DUF4249 domain-containing protein n=1 Tax=Sphingobacterium sp. LRF_L2 TaxID=3369421 RepID=UPI003F63D0B4
MKKIYILILSFFLFASCEKEIDLELDDQSGNIVIEGNVTDEDGPYLVRITKSVAFSESNKYPALSDAVVKISDDFGQEDELTYIGNGYYSTSALQGIPGRTYTLDVMVQGEHYVASSKMPERVELLSLKQDTMKLGGEIRYTVLPEFIDPEELGNRYLFILSVNDRSKINIATISDNIDNGVMNKRSLMPSVDEEDEDDEIVVGDTIHVKMHCIDQTVYRYYTALSQLLDSGGPGGGVTPSNPPSNITNGALGIFSAHTVNYMDLVIE